MPPAAPGRCLVVADPRPGHLHRQHRKAHGDLPPFQSFISRQIVTRSPFDQAAYDNSWLIPRLGLDRYPIEIVPPQRIPRRNCVLCRCPE
jgi:hypothetical protein